MISVAKRIKEDKNLSREDKEKALSEIREILYKAAEHLIQQIEAK